MGNPGRLRWVYGTWAGMGNGVGGRMRRAPDGLGIPLAACRQSGQLPRRAAETCDSSPRSFPNIRILAVLKSESRSDLKGKWANYYTLAMRWTIALRLVHKTPILLAQSKIVILFTENIKRWYAVCTASTHSHSQLVTYWGLVRTLWCHFSMYRVPF